MKTWNPPYPLIYNIIIILLYNIITSVNILLKFSLKNYFYNQFYCRGPYDYDAYMGASTSESGPSSRSIPLDLPSGAEAAGPELLDLPVHLNLDLTESVNPADRRNVSPRNSFPLDLPPNAG